MIFTPSKPITMFRDFSREIWTTQSMRAKETIPIKFSLVNQWIYWGDF